MGIVVVFLSSVVWILSRHLIPARLAWALIGGGLAIAIVGFLDDCFKLAPWPRLAVHTLAAAWAVWCLDAMQPLQPGDSGLIWPWVARAADIAALVWLTNLFNFMDGIDGLAGMEAVLRERLRRGSDASGWLAWLFTALLVTCCREPGLPGLELAARQRFSWVMLEADFSDSRWARSRYSLRDRSRN